MINVLLSTYNGEAYLKELLDSVLNQVNVDLKLSIRDDGSTDDTINIIKSYNDSRIDLKKNDFNMGAKKSFLCMVQNAMDADYYAFCDQDDIWDKEKLSIACDRLSVYSDEPALFISACELIDSNSNVITYYDMNFDIPYSIPTTIMFRSPMGCTMVMNKKLKQIICQYEPASIRMHDFWTLLVALSIKAKVIVDERALIKYRIHEKNTVGLDKSMLARINQLLKSAVRNRYERSNQARELLRGYSKLMDGETIITLEKIANYNKSVRNQYALIMDKRFRWNTYIDSLFIISVILGVF